ncbi:MAG: hypothetical protein J6S23_03940 [Clostridia bacterium]|nr:hypothetical protein [Clostridia bacterium]
MIKKRDKELKFNIVDGVVLFLVIICIATIVNRAVVIEKKYKPLSERNCVVCFEIDVNDEVSKGVVENLNVNDTVTALLKNEKGENTEQVILGSLGSDLTYTDDSKTKVSSYILVKGILTENGVEIDGVNQKINIGDEFEIFTEMVYTKIRIVSIEWEQ